VKVAGRWRYVYRTIDQFGHVIDVFVLNGGTRRLPAGSPSGPSARRGSRREVTTDRAAAYPEVLDDLPPATWQRTDQYPNNRIEGDHGRPKARLRPMRGLKQDRSATVVLAGHALVQNLRRGHDELAIEEPASLRVATAFDEPALAI
jgi:transposase, IS6 family